MSEKNGSTIIKRARRVGVLLPLVFREPFDYRVPDGMNVSPGDYVRVPFGRKSVWGVVWGEADNQIDESKVKAIEVVAAHLPPMSDVMRAFIDWVAWYTCGLRGMVLKMALPLPDVFDPPEMEKLYKFAPSELRITPGRQRVISYLSDGSARSEKDIALHAKVSLSVVREFIKHGGLIESENLASSPEFAKQTIGRSISTKDGFPYHFAAQNSGKDEIVVAVTLSPDQQVAVEMLHKKLFAGFSVTLLDGVTGSGKTEVYFDTIAHAIAAGKQALVLLPEIALSVQWLDRFKKRFGFAPDVWHSGVSPAKKRRTWQHIAEGEARVVVGARSALFLPFSALAVIVVDEEHDASYKQEDGVIYQARDMAVARAAREKIATILVSATPSLETVYNIENGRYTRAHLSSRHGEAELPKIHRIDMRKEKLASGRFLSETLTKALVTCLANKHQAMLFMNRRGYAPLVLCRACGHRFQCPHCSAWLVFHRSHARLLCHHCGHNVSLPKECPDCKTEDSLIPYGPGVERIAEEVRALLPAARIALITSDNAIISTPCDDGKYQETVLTPSELITAMTEGSIDVLVGTQMIAKGHHFAGLALVGVIDADMGLGGGDLRASERTYQLLHQLAGRAGREKIKGEVWLQTYMPQHPVMEALVAGDRDRFMQLEAAMREEASMPPYGKLAAVIVEGKNEQEAMGFARELVRHQASGTRHQALSIGQQALAPCTLQPATPLILGPAPAPLAYLRGKYRYRILVKTEKNFQLQSWLSDWLLARKVPASLKLKIDVDPYSFI